jgi:hypothetical protein
MMFAAILVIAVSVVSASIDNTECMFCGLAVNSIEGLLAENLNEKVIEEKLNTTLCLHLDAELKKTCEKILGEVPTIINGINNHDSAVVICSKLGHCPAVEKNHPDLTPIGRYVIDLATPPNERLKQVWSVPQYKQAANEIFDFLKRIMLKEEYAILEALGVRLLKQYPDEYAQEIEGGATVIGIPPGMLAITQLAYELSEACTSIVVQTADNRILHARNLDFGIGAGLTAALRNLTVEIEYQSAGQTVYSLTTFPGFVGALTGMRVNGFAATINTRFTNQTHGSIVTAMKSLAEAILHAEAGQMLTSFLLRRTLASVTNWQDAVTALHSQKLIDPVYFTVSGVNPGEGAVLTRNITGGDIYPLDVASGRWYVLQTNYDRWTNPPWDDDRRYYANLGMQKMGRDNATFEGLIEVLSTKPVLNLETVYTIVASSYNGTLDTYGRYCNDPCPQ